MKLTSNSTRITLCIISLCAMTLISFSTKAEIYRWVDSRGVVHYTDKLPGQISAWPGITTNSFALKPRPATVVIKPTPAPVVVKPTPAPVVVKPTPVTVVIKPTPAPAIPPVAAIPAVPASPTTSTAATPTSSAWTLCANEGGVCNFTGTKQVRYGAGSKFAAGTFSGSVACSNSVFGDPIQGTVKRCEVSTASTSSLVQSPTTSNMNGGAMGMPIVNAALAPPPEIGYGVLRLVPQNHSPIKNAGANANNGEFRISCGYAKMANDDPIVYPGQSGRSHHHTFFGNTGINANSTTASLIASGNSTCEGGLMNRSSYWTPSMIDTASGAPLRPSGANMYYKTANKNKVNTPPKGLRMIAGNHLSSDPQSRSVAEFYCGNVPGQASIPNCKQGDHLVAIVRFPYCWNGKDLDSPDHKSHMAYEGKGGCPATHPVLIPEITYNIRYEIPTSAGTSKWRLASDMYSASKPSGYSLHGDWMNGWTTDPVTGKNFVDIFNEKCLKAGMNCGNALLGDGRQYYY